MVNVIFWSLLHLLLKNMYSWGPAVILAPLCPGWDLSLVASAKEEPEVERTETAELPRASAELGSAWLKLARQHMRLGTVCFGFVRN